MSLVTWAGKKIVAGKAKSLLEDTLSGKFGNVARAVWLWLDGKKTLIWALVLAGRHAAPGLPIWSWVDVVANAIGWHDIAPAIDPDALLTWITLGIALGHKVDKALRGEPVELEWTKIGEVPPVKDLSKAPEAAVLKVITPDFEFVEVRSKETIPVGHSVITPDHRQGVIMSTKESTATGYTYVVRVEKKANG
jgi:hypothetical protein